MLLLLFLVVGYLEIQNDDVKKNGPHMFVTDGPYSDLGSSGMEGLIECTRNMRIRLMEKISTARSSKNLRWTKLEVQK